MLPGSPWPLEFCEITDDYDHRLITQIFPHQHVYNTLVVYSSYYFSKHTNTICFLQPGLQICIPSVITSFSGACYLVGITP